MLIPLSLLYITSEVLFWTKVHLKLLLEVMCSEVQKWIQQNAQITTTCSKICTILHRKSYSAMQWDVGSKLILICQNCPLGAFSHFCICTGTSKCPVVKLCVPPEAAHLTSILAQNYFISIISNILDSVLLAFVMTWILVCCFQFLVGFFVDFFFNLKALYATLTQANCSFP